MDEMNFSNEFSKNLGNYAKKWEEFWELWRSDILKYLSKV